MAKIKKYQKGGGLSPRDSFMFKKIPGTSPMKRDTTKPAPYYKMIDDYKEPGSKKRESEMMKELKKKGSMPASKKNVGRKGIKVGKAKNGKSFPDLNKDGKITKADILKGRGVIRNGGKMKKAQDGVFAPITAKKSKVDSVINKRRAAMDSSRAAFSRKLQEAKAKIKSGKKSRNGSILSPSKKNTSNRLSSYGRVIGKSMRMGGTMKKCRGGCY
jgi:hypothetical protein